MTHNALSRSLDRIPMWMIQTALGAVLSGGIAWTTWATVQTNNHATKIAVVETKVDDVQSDIHEIKELAKETNKKLDRVIEGRINGSAHNR